MTTITIELTDEQAKQLASEADHRQISPEQLAAEKVADSLAARKTFVTQSIRQIIQENAELYRRLS